MENELWEYLKTAQKPIVLYGMGNGADKIINVLNDKNIPFHGIFASDGFVRNKTFHGFKITSYREQKEKFGDMIVLLCFGSEREEVIENVKRISAEQELFAPDVPVVGDTLFDREYLLKNKAEFEQIYNMLADDLSRKTFENVINYKLSGKIGYLFDCETDQNEPYASFLKLCEKESFLDLGAYNGDTVEDFIARCPDYKKITAVEPDKKSFKKLLNNTERFRDIECLNVGVSDFCGVAEFGMRSGRSSGVWGGDTSTPFITVDSILDSTQPTFIKMDVEGEEENVIMGAQNTIEALKPKMLISCYHRTEDIINIPNAVLELRKDYKLYMRHFSALPAWDINYYVV